MSPEYRLIMEGDGRMLEQEANWLLGKGWLPLGGIAIAIAVDGSTTFVQAFVHWEVAKRVMDRYAKEAEHHDLE